MSHSKFGLFMTQLSDDQSAPEQLERVIIKMMKHHVLRRFEISQLEKCKKAKIHFPITNNKRLTADPKKQFLLPF